MQEKNYEDPFTQVEGETEEHTITISSTDMTSGIVSNAAFEYAAKDDVILMAARVAHEINRVWCAENDDHSQGSWESAPQWQKDSAIEGVKFHMKNVNAGDSASHDNWMKQKRQDGWQYGPVKNPGLKQHPCMVPFEKLPRDQQVKDALFRMTVHSIMNKYGLKI